MLLHEHLENGADKNPNFPFSDLKKFAFLSRSKFIKQSLANN